MVTLSSASIVIVAFSFSDLSGSKLRPAVVLAEAGRDDWILCQVTSNPHSDPNAVRLMDESFSKGALSAVSFARPTKLFTANSSLMNKQVAILKDKTFKKIIKTTIDKLQENVPK
jgi:mRNA interferase MazF